MELKNTLHLKAPGNWINDPNGFIYYKGKYHLFYQHFPFAPVWGTMHWGHAISDDLINWEHLGVALFPTKEYDRNGIFSGSAIEKDGEMYLYYTSVKYVEENPDNIHHSLNALSIQSQAMIVSEDGYSFDNYNGKVHIIPAISDTSIADPGECRDPKVWKQGDCYLMCLASTHLKEEGVLVIYRSLDAKNWSYFNRLQDKRLGNILECPDLFEVDGQWILVASPMGIMKGSEYREDQAICRMVDFDPNSGTVKLKDNYKFLDYGMDLYAPQTNTDEKGNRTLIAWVRMPVEKSANNNSASNGKPWNGMMALPRVVSVRDGEIYTGVHPAVLEYFSDSKCNIINTLLGIVKTRDDNSMLETHIKEGDEIDAFGLKICLKDGLVITDRSNIVSSDIDIHKVCKTPYIGNECKLTIFNEPDLIEVFINDGQYVISNVRYD